MGRGDDLTGLFAKPGGDPLRMRQGVIVTWNLLSGSGTVNVAGTILTDVPFLTPGGLVWLIPGDPVVLLAQGSAWFILGRVVQAGGAKAIGRNTSISIPGGGDASNFSLTNAFATKVTVNMAIPLWARVATVDATIYALAKNTTGGGDFINAQIVMPDSSISFASSASVPTTAWGQITLRRAVQVFVTPGGTLTVLGQLRATVGPWTADPASSVGMAVVVDFNSNAG